MVSAQTYPSQSQVATYIHDGLFTKWVKFLFKNHPFTTSKEPNKLS